MTDSSQRRHAMIDEVTPGTTPATPAWQILRLTSGGMAEQNQYQSSEEIRADANVPDVTLVARDVAGEFPFEFSYGSFDMLIEKALRAQWATNVLKNANLHKTFSYEITDEMGATDDFERYVGCMVNTMNLNIAARDKVTGSFGIMGTSMGVATAIIAGATYTAAGVNPIMSGSNDIGALTIGGSPGPKILSMVLNTTNNLDLRPVVGSLASNGLRKGQFVVSGSLNAYFDDVTLRDLQRAGGYTTIQIVIGVGASLKYTVLLPKVKLMNAPKSTPGNNEDIMLNLEFQGVYDATEACSMKWTRVP